MTVRSALCLLLLGSVATAVRAETVYVVEQLVVSVSSAPDGESERVAQVKSADKLELIERQGDAAHVRLPNGKEGWIKASYISTEAPLQVRLDERTAELEKLKQEADKLRQDASRLQTEVTSARAAAVTAQTAAANAAASATPSAPIRETVFLREPDRPGQTPWALLLGLSLSMLLVGFALGWIVLDRRIRRRYGGLRIY